MEFFGNIKDGDGFKDGKEEIVAHSWDFLSKSEMESQTDFGELDSRFYDDLFERCLNGKNDGTCKFGFMSAYNCGVMFSSEKPYEIGALISMKIKVNCLIEMNLAGDSLSLGDRSSESFVELSGLVVACEKEEVTVGSKIDKKSFVNMGYSRFKRDVYHVTLLYDCLDKEDRSILAVVLHPYPRFSDKRRHVWECNFNGNN